MRYSKIREMDISNGEGIGISLFVQGCHFHCKGCFNQETWDFEGGQPWTSFIEDKFLNLANKPYIQRISILGGEPLCDENVIDVFNLIKRIRIMYPTKKIWLYTGYEFSEIVSEDTFGKTYWDLLRKNCVKNVDIVVDGKFQIDKQDLYNENIIWAGSTNQHVIDAKGYFKRKEANDVSD